MSNQWKPLPTMDSQVSSAFSNFPRQQQGRQITKNPQNMFQALPGGGGGGGNGFNQSPPSPNSPYGGRMSNGGMTSPSFSGSSSGLSRLLGVGQQGNGGGFLDTPNSYGMGGSVARMESTRLSPSSLLSSNGFSGGGGGSAFTNLQQQQQQQQHRGGGGINGFESTMSGGGGGFDRSMSTVNGFNDAFGGRTNNQYDRQMSAPNLRDQYGYGRGGGGMNDSRDGYGNSRGGGGGGGGGNPNFFVGERRPGGGGSNSPPMYGKNDAGGMTIGTWNDVPTSSNSSRGGGGYGNGGNGGGGSSMNFEIGTFNIGTFNGGDGGGSGGGGNNYGSSSSSNAYSQSGHNIQGGPGIRETGIIEKLLVSVSTCG